MKRIVIYLYVILISAAGASSGFAQTEKQKNAINHVGDVMAIASLCPSLEVNDLWVASALKFHDIDLDDKKFFNLLRDRAMGTKTNFADTEQEIVCASGTLLYGKNGINVKNFLIEK